jgi:hypothetical protein
VNLREFYETSIQIGMELDVGGTAALVTRSSGSGARHERLGATACPLLGRQPRRTTGDG